ncbi:MAG TPA: hypothetical protein VGM17_17165 [Rhizomicrobium sp.]|jgi:hypothetical protein
MLVKVRRIEVSGPQKLRLWFTDGSMGERDFADELAQGGPMAEPLRDPSFLAQVFLDFGAPTWPNGYDMAPWALHEDMSNEGLLRHAESV